MHSPSSNKISYTAVFCLLVIVVNTTAKPVHSSGTYVQASDADVASELARLQELKDLLDAMFDKPIASRQRRSKSIYKVPTRRTADVPCFFNPVSC
uniref:Neuropeptide-Like Protein n=1 Tax=Panagrellus redivivus TaxID=6233 RepID=A0A7E4V5B0_PANRE